MRRSVAPLPSGDGDLQGAQGDRSRRANGSLHGPYHPEYDGYPNPKIWRGRLVKQADVALLQYPLEVEMNRTVRENDLSWYEKYTDPDGPAMTWSVFAINWMVLGNYTRAKGLFRRAHANNIKPPFNVWTETTKGGCTPFLTGAGGFLQAVVHGIGGLRVRSDRLSIRAAPPSVAGERVTALVIDAFHWRGARLSVTVTNMTVSVRVCDAKVSAPALGLLAPDGVVHALVVGGPPVVVARDGTSAVVESRSLRQLHRSRFD